MSIIDTFAMVVEGLANRRMVLANCCPVCARRAENTDGTSLRGTVQTIV